jgi:hypothetical protein
VDVTIPKTFTTKKFGVAVRLIPRKLSAIPYFMNV